jgi:hypothetical protein
MSRSLHWLTRLFGSDPTQGEPVDMMREGAPLWADAFGMSEAEATRLGRALATLADTFPSRAAPRLERALVVGRWPSSRSAVNALRDEGTGAMWAAPSVAAWLVLAEPACPRDDAYAGYGLREACFALADWRNQAAQHRDAAAVAVDAALAELERFLDGRVEPALLAILARPIWLVHRGVVAYLRDAARGDLAACVAALEVHVDAPVPNRDNGDLVYGHSDALRVLGQLSARLEGEDAQGDWQNANNLHAPLAPDPGAIAALRGTLTLLAHHPDAGVRRAAAALDDALDDAGE